jgi:hypothetical protein
MAKVKATATARGANCIHPTQRDTTAHEWGIRLLSSEQKADSSASLRNDKQVGL